MHERKAVPILDAIRRPETNAMRFTPILLLLVGLLGSNAAAQPAKPTAKDKPNASQDAAIAAIKKLGGRVTIDTKSLDRPVIHVTLSGPKVTDAGLVHLKGLTSLERLDLHDTQVSDAGLVNLKGLTSLQTLFLDGNQVTDAGVKELRAALPNCRMDRKW